MNEPLPVRIPWEYQGARPAGDLTQHTWTWRDSYLVELRDSLQNVQRRWIGQDGTEAHGMSESDAPETCGKCREPFDPTDTRWDGKAR